MTDVRRLGRIEAAFHYVESRLFIPATDMLCDFAGDFSETYSPHNPSYAALPTPAECSASVPNPAGYATGIEDGTLAGGTMLDACVTLYGKTGDRRAATLAVRFAHGLLSCAESAKSEGFVPRGLCPADAKSHYIDTSRDQYTLFAFGLHRFLGCELCTRDDRLRIAHAAEAVARRAERNMTAENGYDMLNEVGGKTLVATMWGPSLGNHETMRLPALYLFAYAATGDAHWLSRYRSVREEGLSRCLPMTGYWALYTLHQMQSSLRLCYDLEPDDAFRARILTVMQTVAAYTAELAPGYHARLGTPATYNVPQTDFRHCEMRPLPAYAAIGIDAVKPHRPDESDYFVFQSIADLLLVPALVPRGTVPPEVNVVFDAAYDMIDYRVHERNLPVYYLCAMAHAL